MGFRSKDTPERHFSFKYKDKMDQLAQDHERARQHFRNHVMERGFPLAPTTASTQGGTELDPTGPTTWRIDVEKMLVVVDGVLKYLPYATDWVLHSGSQLVAVGQSCVAACVAKNVSGTVSFVTVKGTPASIGAAVGPSDSVIDAAVGSSNEWVKIAETRVDRTAWDTLVQYHNPAARPMLAVNVDTAYGDFTFLDSYFPRK
jgi:hypothetical protein